MPRDPGALGAVAMLFAAVIIGAAILAAPSRPAPRAIPATPGLRVVGSTGGSGNLSTRTPPAMSAAPTPSAQPLIGDAALSAGQPSHRETLRGRATWFAARGYVAAAGPRLRRFLGAHWRGTLVSVCIGGRTWMSCVAVRLTDWCACGHALIDVSDDAFRSLAPLSKGVLRVTVQRLGPVALPATDA